MKTAVALMKSEMTIITYFPLKSRHFQLNCKLQHICGRTTNKHSLTHSHSQLWQTKLHFCAVFFLAAFARTASVRLLLFLFLLPALLSLNFLWHRRWRRHRRRSRCRAHFPLFLRQDDEHELLAHILKLDILFAFLAVSCVWATNAQTVCNNNKMHSKFILMLARRFCSLAK